MSYWLVMKTADAGERPFPISKERTVIGRGPRSDLRIAMPTVAQRHCELILRKDELQLTDLGSDEGTLRNGHRVEHAKLGHSDQLTVGPITFEVRVTRESPGALPELKTGRKASPDPTP
ncbi:MAG: FHA domain-containing protein [Phycisphaerae bacterium]|nr:FHA domain-containing protein [Phycisphaerae bacterium]NNF42492.1 FHA domain-containing protein [Phycisphaerales bacterium]